VQGGKKKYETFDIFNFLDLGLNLIGADLRYPGQLEKREYKIGDKVKI
jgi:hypothetical protein